MLAGHSSSERRTVNAFHAVRLTGCLVVLSACVSCVQTYTPDAEPSAPVGAATDVPKAQPATEPVDPEAAGPEMDDIDRSNQVLRHAVFFSFKEDSSEEDVAAVADAFAALPSKIEEIIDFQWGVNNSPEELNDGFTHCFLLTFKDAAGRAVYLPHAAHKAFGDVLRPHMSDVFVVDYWGTPQDSPLETELKHAVFLKFKDDAAAEDVTAVEEGFASLPEKIDAIKAFEWGKNNSPETHDDGFTHCVMVTFADDDGRAEYLPHADHKAFVEILTPVLDKVRVLDFIPAK